METILDFDDIIQYHVKNLYELFYKRKEQEFRYSLKREYLKKIKQREYQKLYRFKNKEKIREYRKNYRLKRKQQEAK